MFTYMYMYTLIIICACTLNHVCVYIYIHIYDSEYHTFSRGFERGVCSAAGGWLRGDLGLEPEESRSSRGCAQGPKRRSWAPTWVPFREPTGKDGGL